MKIVGNRLEGARWMESPNHGGPLQERDTVVIHYTSGGDAVSAVRWLCSPPAQASAHLVIGRDAAIYQLVAFDTVAWHAGKSAYQLPDGTRREGYNSYSLGIELDNAGVLQRSGDRFLSWFGRSYAEEEVCRATHRNESAPQYWLRYTEAQVAVTEELCRLLMADCGIKYILGHEEIAPLRKRDPGPAFPLDKLRERIYNPRREEGPEDPAEPPRTGLVTAPQLNIRSGPGSEEPPVAKPLDRGARVSILEEQGGWYRVRAEVEGWVSGRYVDVRPT